MYATIQDMIDRFGETEILQLSDREIPRSGVIDEGRVQRAIDDAESTANSYMQGRITVPVEPVPDVLNKNVCDLARANLYDDSITETVQKKADAAMKWFQDFAMGKVSFGDETVKPANVYKTAASASNNFDFDCY